MRTPRSLLFALPRAARARRPGARRRPSAGQPPVGHVFVVCSRTRTPTSTFAPDSPAPYLSQTLPSQGAFIPEYYGVTHLSLGNYIALVSGQGSNPQTQADCQVFTDFVGAGLSARTARRSARAASIPPTCKTVADQLDGARPDLEGLHGGHGQRPRARAGSAGTRR